MNLNTHFHTHPTQGYNRNDIESAGISDKKFRDHNRSFFENFLILTREARYPYDVQTILYNNH